MARTRTRLAIEEVSGRYVDRTRQVILEGSTVTDASHDRPERLAVGSYSAVLTADERSLVQGRWGSTADNEAGFAVNGKRCDEEWAGALAGPHVARRGTAGLAP